MLKGDILDLLDIIMVTFTLSAYFLQGIKAEHTKEKITTLFYAFSEANFLVIFLSFPFKIYE